jgi:very-short-patch-repair endonuclease
MSSLEETFALQLRALNINGFEREYRFHPVRRWRFDFANPEQKLAIELHGAIYTQGRHSRGKGIEGDMEKINEAQILGWDVLCFSGGMVKSGEAINQIERILKVRAIEQESK